MSQKNAPLVVDVKPDLLGLERVVSKRQMTALLERGENGNGGNSGSHDNGGSAEEAQLASLVIPGIAPAPGAQTNPWALSEPAPEPQVEPQPLSFAAPQPAPEAPASFFPGVAPQAVPPSVFNQTTLVETPSAPQMIAVPEPAPQPQQAMVQMPFAALTTPADPPAPTANDFFASAPPAPPVETQAQAPSMGQTMASAAAGAAVGAVVGTMVGAAVNKSFDFFGAPSNQPDTPPPGPPMPTIGVDAPPPPPTEGGEYQLGDRSDFFASAPNKVASEVAPPPVPAQPIDTDAPPLGAKSAPSSSDQELPPIAASTERSASSDGFDFFAVSPPKVPKALVEEGLYPDESHMRGRAKETKVETSSPISLFTDDDDDVKPKIARPRGYTPKEGAVATPAQEEKSKSESEDGESFFKEKPAVPPRRSFSGKDTTKKAKSTDSEEDEDHEKPAKKEGFLHQDVNMLGMSMTRQNQMMLIGIVGFVGMVFFNMIGVLLNGVTVPLPPPPAAAQLPTLNGEWKIRYFDNGQPNGKGEMMGLKSAQKGLDVQGMGSDRFGPYKVVGTFVPPNKVELKKTYTNYDQSKPIVYRGIFTPGSQPIYVAGRWSYKHVVGHFLKAQVREDGGAWEGNFYPVVQAGVPDDGGQPKPQPTNPMPWDQLIRWWTDLPFANKLLCGAIGAVATALGILFGSLVIFGPSGKMNIWAKQKYIPSQFNSQHNKMVRELSKPLKPGGLPLGTRCEWKPWLPWQAKDLSITPKIRENDPHVLILGAGDKGKTRLMAHMIAHDIESNDRAVIVIDSDGGLTEIITRWVASHAKAKEFSQRVVLLDPTFKGNTLGYNPLELPDDEDLQSAASSLVYGFKAIYTEPPGAQSQWNQQTANILRNAALLLMVNGKTLTDLPALLNDNDFRDVLLESIEKKKKDKAEYITLLDTWGQYKKLARTDQWINWVEPILNRVGPMLSDSRIRSILTKPVGDIKLRKLIQEKKVLIVKVAKGQLDQNANLLGSLIVTGVKQAALSLANEAPAKQPPVAMYLDEFDNFIEKETIEAITSETDKFKIGFIGCIKTLQHLPEDFRNQLIIAVGTMACFALAKKDGDLLGPQMFRVDGRKIKHQTIQNFFNKVNTSPQFELISDEEKLNIDRVVGQEERTFFCYRVGTVAGVFHMKAHDFDDIPDAQVKKKYIERMHGIVPEAKK